MHGDFATMTIIAENYDEAVIWLNHLTNHSGEWDYLKEEKIN
jgi:hypothetical protein